MIISDFHETDEVKGWPTAAGVVTRADHVNQDKFHSTDYRIGYEYLVKGERFNSQEFRIWGANKSDFDKYKVGTPVNVHYNPSSPSVSFVETSINQENIPRHVIGNILVYALGIAVFLFKKKQPQQE
jgi:hypothetical protein